MMRPRPGQGVSWSSSAVPQRDQESPAPSQAVPGSPDWTTDVPAVPGWYWLRHAVFQTALGQWHEPHPVVVELVPDATGQLLVYMTGSTWTRSVVDLIVGEWSGPLALPE